MKKTSSFPLATVCSVLAFMMGWWVRGDAFPKLGKASESPPKSSDHGAISPSGQSLGERPMREPRETAAPLIESPEEGTDAVAGRAGLDAYLARDSRQFEMKIASWTRLLRLDASQQKQLRDAYLGRQKGIEAAWSDDGLDPSADPKLRKEPVDEELLSELIRPEQQEAYDHWKSEKADQQTRAFAISKLAGLESLALLSPEQSEAVYARYQESAANNSPQALSTRSIGSTFSADISTRMAETGGDYRETADMLARERIKQETTLLSDILHPDQSEALRLSLEEQYRPWLIAR